MRLHTTAFVCVNCGGSFLRYPSEIRRGRTTYCSFACYQATRRLIPMRPCGECGRIFKPSPGNPGVYCSNACYHSGLGTPEERLLAHRRINPETGCWEWTGGTWKGGYGRLMVNGRADYAHRVAARIWLGLDDGPRVLHKCDNPPCFNPEHLFGGTLADNIRDCVAKERNARGERNGSAKLTEAHVRAIRVRYAAGGTTNKRLAAEFGVSPTLISVVINRKLWSHV